MALSPGTRLGPYEVVSALGAGGMGEVYRATDSRLGRDVAIKILPAAVAADPERRARFEREARTLAALNHLNIAHLHGLEERVGMTALVMELVDGLTLDQLIDAAVGLAPSGSEARKAVGVGPHGKLRKVGGLPVAEVLPIARQIADALECAHESGIVHRDLKPQNVKVRDDGTVKVLDFGLAKALALEGASGSADSQNSPTLTAAGFGSPATQLGVILGTAAYMSPEQARGKSVDKRADIWAFGVVLYEMLTGRRAFQGEEISDVLAAVLRQDIDWSALPADTPPRIRHLLERCLDRDVKTRLRDMGEARVALASPDAGTPTSTTSQTIPAHDRRGISIPVAAAIAVIAASIAALATWALRSPAAATTPASVVRLPFVAPDTVVSEIGDTTISPDGKTILFSGRGTDGRKVLWLRALDSTEATPLPDTDEPIEPFWSPDSKSIAFGAQGKLKRLDLGSTRAQVLTNAARSNNGAWSRHGVIVFGPDYGSPLYKIAATGGERTLASPPGDRGAAGDRYPFFLPDGRHFIYSGGPQRTMIGSIDSMERKELTGVGGGAVFAPPNWLLYVRNGIVVAHAFDLAKLELVGEPRPIAPAAVGGWGRGARVSVSETGVLLITNADAYDYQLAWFDRNGKAGGTLGPIHTVSAVQIPRISPDGSRVAIQINDQRAQNQDLWLGSVATGSFDRFTTAKQFEQMPVWSSDGASVFMATAVNTVAGIYQMPVGGGALETIAEGVIFPQDTSRDGRWLFYQHRGDSTRLDIWALRLTNGLPAKDAKPQAIVNSEFEETSPQISPDGQWLAYQSDVTGMSEIYVRRFVDGRAGPSMKVAPGHGTMPRWSKDGRTLFYVSAPLGNLSAQMMSVAVTPSGDTLTPSAPTSVFKARMLPLGTVSRDYDIAPDGRFLVGTVVGPTKGTAATVVLNWMEVVK